MKPRLRELIPGYWRCMGGGTVGYGPTPERAYAQWRKRVIESPYRTPELVTPEQLRPALPEWLRRWLLEV